MLNFEKKIYSFREVYSELISISPFEIFKYRHDYIRKYGFILLNKELINVFLDLLKKDTKILEIGSGTGYFMYNIRKKNKKLQIDCVDTKKGKYGFTYDTFFYAIKKDGVSFYKENKNEYNSIFIIWPSYESKYATYILKEVPENVIVYYCGEWKGGCCGSDCLFEEIRKNFIVLKEPTKELNKYYISFPSIYDNWKVLKRKEVVKK